jgi:NAD(P)-dependent dehydrogenase (short-subunit alcohol dehydrogenase family)
VNRSIFITGGGSGLGLAVAERAAQLGWRVALAGRQRARLDAAARALEPTGAQLSSFALDVADAEAVDAAIRAANPDALLCAAGILGRGAAVDELTAERFRAVLEVNVIGTFNACRAAMRLWREHGKSGDIVNVGSLAGIRGLQRFPGFAAYAASKHAIVGLTEALALEGKPLGIRVNAIAPGTMKSAMTEELGLDPSTLPQNVAPTVEFLLDRQRSGPLTGSTVEIFCND